MKKAISPRETALIGVFTSLTIILAQIIIPLPPPMVQISLGLVGVYMTGILLAPKHAVLTQLVYLLLGAAGLPVFGGFKGGLSALFGPTGGYLIVYPIMAAIVSLALNSQRSLAEESSRKIFFKAAIAICAAHILLYLGGTAWLSVLTGNTFAKALGFAVYPYIPLDIVKIIFCVAVVVPLRSRLRGMRLLMLGAKAKA
jgi:biotin transport system substrate-specific component